MPFPGLRTEHGCLLGAQALAVAALCVRPSSQGPLLTPERPRPAMRRRPVSPSIPNEEPLEETTLSEDVDIAVIGMGPGGEVAASRLLAAGRRVAVIERELVRRGMRLLGLHPIQDRPAPQPRPAPQSTGRPG